MPLAIAALAAVLLSGCGNSVDRQRTDAAQRFATFTDDYFRAYFSFRPSEGTSAGLHEYDEQLEAWSAQRWHERAARLRAQLSALDDVRKLPLNESDAIDAAILDGQIRAELQDIEVIRSWRINPLRYVYLPGRAVDMLMKRSFAPDAERVRLVTSRLRKVPELLREMDNNLGSVPQVFAELALRTVRGSMPFFANTIPEWGASTSASEDAKLALREASRVATESLRRAAVTLQNTTLPLASGQFAIGAATFREKLQFEEMVQTPLEQLLAIGEANLEKDYNAFLSTAKAIDPRKSPVDVFGSLALQHPSETDLIGSAQRRTESIRLFVHSRNLVPLPSEVRPSITPTPPFMRSFGFAFMDTPGAYEPQAREAFYYITPPEPEWTPDHKQEHLRLFNRSVMDIITIHEAWPGHYVQFLYAPQFPTRTRKLTSCGTNAEGWAHYTEQMMLEEGFGGGDPKVRLAQLAEALVRDARFVAGIKLHTAGWTVDQARDLFRTKAFLDDANALQEAQRGTFDPLYLYYTLGKLEIYKLREEVRARKGSTFRLGDFHRDFVSQGAIPIPMVRRILLGDTKSGKN